MMTAPRTPTRSVPYFALAALSLSLGWGIRGNFGHEYGAMIPGALAAMAAVLLSGRGDWHRRIVYFAMFGALGWSFGGSMSYMQVVAYTHSGHSVSVLYGFACLFVIGFLWAAMGGAGAAIPAVADSSFRDAVFLPAGLVFLLWWLQGVAIEPSLQHAGYALDWNDTDWLAALLAVIAAVIAAVIRRRLDPATSLVLHLAGGWWAGFLLLVVMLGLRMTPPRGDNWSGCVGMTAALLWYCRRPEFHEAARAALVCGFIGGIGFAAASMLKLVEVTSGLETNWHSILEQTTGLFNGIGLACALAGLAGSTRFTTEGEERNVNRWTELAALGFVVLGITYLNLRKNVAQWVAVKAVPPVMAGLAAGSWFDLAYALLALGLLALWIRHGRSALSIVPESWLGKGQLLYLVLLWWLVAGNFERALVAFKAERLVTEGVIYVVALVCTVIVLVAPAFPGKSVDRSPGAREPGPRMRLPPLVLLGLGASILSIVIDWAIVRAIYGDRFAGHASLHIRFGPDRTVNRAGTPR